MGSLCKEKGVYVALGEQSNPVFQQPDFLFLQVRSQPGSNEAWDWGKPGYASTAGWWFSATGVALWAPHSQDVEDLYWELLRYMEEHKIWEVVEVEYIHFS